MEIHKKIKDLRIRNNINQIDLAKSIGLSRSGYLLIENGKTKAIPIDIGLKLAKALDVSFNDLFDIIDEDANSIIQSWIEECEYRLERVRSRRSLLRVIQNNLQNCLLQLSSSEENKPISATLAQIIQSIEDLEQFKKTQEEIDMREVERTLHLLESKKRLE